MGLYDWIDLDMKCPNCNKNTFVEFQTKDIGCTFNPIFFGHIMEEEEIVSFLGSCEYCQCFITAWAIVENQKLEGLRVYRYEVSLEKDIIIRKSEGERT